MKLVFNEVGWKSPSKELWLEFGKINSNSGLCGWHDVFWYNEGNARETGYWLKNLFKDLFKKNRYYLIRYAGISFYLKGGWGGGTE